MAQAEGEAMTFTPCPKEPVYRCRRMLDLAKQAPICFHCGRPNDGTVVGAHINAQWAGKGMGTKSHDLVAFLCQRCHGLYDNPGNLQEFGEVLHQHDFLKAQYKSTVWLLSAGFLKVVSNP